MAQKVLPVQRTVRVPGVEDNRRRVDDLQFGCGAANSAGFQESKMFDRLFQLTRNVPKVFDPKTHEALDHFTTATFMLIGAAFWGRHRRASAVALINGAFVLGLTLLTDYDGDGKRPISFRQHGELDVVQAAMAAGLPTVMGFGNSWAALPFRLQAANEMLVVSVTDFEGQGTVADERGISSRAA
jgi:hypothetical protein